MMVWLRVENEREARQLPGLRKRQERRRRGGREGGREGGKEGEGKGDGWLTAWFQNRWIGLSGVSGCRCGARR
jgi:hypothetical protein